MGYQPPLLDGSGATISRPLFPDTDFLQRSQIYHMSAGRNQPFSITLHENVSSSPPSPGNPETEELHQAEIARVDLTIVIAPSISEKQVTFVKCQERAKAEVLHQIILTYPEQRSWGNFLREVGHREQGWRKKRLSSEFPCRS